MNQKLKEQIKLLNKYKGQAEEAMFVLRQYGNKEHEPASNMWTVTPSVLSNDSNISFEVVTNQYRPWHISVCTTVPSIGVDYQIGVVRYDPEKGFVIWNLISLTEFVISPSKISETSNETMGVIMMAFFISPEVLEED